MKKALMCFLSLLAFGAVAQDVGQLSDKLDRIEADVILMQRRLYKGTDNAQDNNIAEDLYTKVEQQSQLIQDLTAKVETLSHDLEQITHEMKKFMDDVDMRFKMAGTNTPVVSTPNKDKEKLYNKAYQALKAGNFDQAESDFTQFLKDFPDDKLAGNANYWLGETYYVRGQYAEASGIFATGVKTYKDNIKAPDNLLKLGMTLDKMGEKEKACTAFSSLETEFPKASSTVKERAQQEAEKIACP